MPTRREFLTAAAACGLAPAAPQESAGPAFRLWYDEPASHWNEALPIGNGRLGAMVFGGVPEERLQINDDTLVSGAPGIDDLPLDVTRRFDEVVALLRQRRFAEASGVITRSWTGRSWQCYQPAGDAFFSLALPGPPQGYSRELLLDEALARAVFHAGEIIFTEECFASFPHRVIAVRFLGSRYGSLSVRARLSSPHPTARVEPLGRTALRLRGRVPGFVLRRTLEWVEKRGEQWKYPELWNADGTRKPGAQQVLYEGEAGRRGTEFELRLALLFHNGMAGIDRGVLAVDGASEAVFLIGSWSAVRNNDLDAEMRAALAASWDTLLRAHREDYQRLFRRCTVDFGASPQSSLPTDERIERFAGGADPALAALYFHYARYLMISGSRPGTEPLNLQGIWNAEVIPPWASGYTLNINTEMNYWLAGPANLPECAEPLLRMVRELSQSGARVARSMYRRPGWVAHHNTTLWRGAWPVDNDAMPSFWPMAAPWLCRHLWEQYEFTQDRALLADIYPILRGAAEFLLAWLIENDEGFLVTPAGNSPENLFVYTDSSGQKRTAGVCMGPTMDLALARDLFTNCITAASLLGVDGEFRARLASARARLLPYRIGARGQVQEWPEDFEERDPQHRHVSHLYPLHPGMEWNPDDTPGFCDAARRSLELRGDGGTGWSRAWKVCLWARLRDGGRAWSLLARLFEPARTAPGEFRRGGVMPNLLCSHPPFQIDGNFGGAAGILEMLLQSRAVPSRPPLLHLLPALPPALPSGELRGALARGGFEVDIQWSGGQLSQARIRCATPRPCLVRYGSRTIEAAAPVVLSAPDFA
ncbi:MAG: glycoside hydrolase family 95 protein [Bryobacteraceae bacterium]|nr:glycoside hydrolase family 95 protein [Bryobacteraceae bacterium]